MTYRSNHHYNGIRRYLFYKKTPDEYGTLPKDVDGYCYNTDFNYASIVFMLLYLLGRSRPELAFSVSQCARYTLSPKLSHEKALKRIGLYLIGTRCRTID